MVECKSNYLVQYKNVVDRVLGFGRASARCWPKNILHDAKKYISTFSTRVRGKET